MDEGQVRERPGRLLGPGVRIEGRTTRPGRAYAAPTRGDRAPARRPEGLRPRRRVEDVVRTTRPGRVEDVVRTTRRRRTAAAFTLIEILIALMVLSVGMASVLAVFIAGVRASRDVVDESAAALSAKAVLVRILTEEATDEDGMPVRLFLNEIVKAREDQMRHVWIHPLAFAPPENAYFGDDDGAPRAAPVAAGSHYSWRCRASSCRSNPKNPVRDLGRKGGGRKATRFSHSATRPSPRRKATR